MANALDTNCVVYWLVGEDIHRVNIVDGFLNNSRTKVHIADLVVAETVWVLKKVYGFDDALIMGFVRKLVEHENINCNKALFTKVVEEYKHTPKVSFVDLCLVQYARLSEQKLLTFDQTLAKRFPKHTELVV